jgi:hypothetical protein
MKAADLLLVALVASLATFVAVQAGASKGAEGRGDLSFAGRVSVEDAPPDGADALRADADAEGPMPVALASARVEERASERSRFVPDVPRPAAWPASEMRRRLAQAEAGTYIGALLAARDSVLTRWPERVITPLRVWIGDGGTLDGWDPLFPRTVRDAFEAWADTGIPLRFTYVRDSIDADVRVRFVAQFPQGISGRTVWSRDTASWLVGGEIDLAITHPRGDVVSEGQLHAIALHEVGHLLGLDHVDDPEHIMAPKVRARSLSEGDRATVRLLYSVPAGAAR